MIKTPNISICVVAKNAANTTEPLFNSLKEFADRRGDMVLVDTGSTDNTPAIYKAFGFRVFEVGDKFHTTIDKERAERINAESSKNEEPEIVKEGDQLFNFAAARNYAASLALHDYILNPDADEAFTVFDIDKVEEMFQKYSRFQYDFVFSHKPDGSPELFFVTDTRASDRRFWAWKGIVHETNEPIQPNATMGYVPPSILKIEHFQKPSPTRSSYLAALAYACDEEPKNDRNLHYYARELMYRGFYKTAIDKFRLHLKLSNWDYEKCQSHIFMGDCFKYLGDLDSAVQCWIRATLEAPARRDGWLRLAGHYFSQGNAHATIAYASAAVGLPPVSFYGRTPEYYTTYPYHLLYWAYQRIGKIEDARVNWMIALSMDPKNEAFQYDAIFFKRDEM